MLTTFRLCLRTLKIITMIIYSTLTPRRGVRPDMNIHFRWGPGKNSVTLETRIHTPPSQINFNCSGMQGNQLTYPYLISKLLNMSREYLGKCIQFFTGHGWWNKHLKLTNLSNTAECRLCQVNDSVESPIHIFLECVAMTATRQGLFNDPFPTQQIGKNQLCQVAKLALIDIVHNLINIDHNHSNVNSSE